MVDTYEDLTVSLEPHLVETLRRVQTRLPPSLADKLGPYISSSQAQPQFSSSEIPTIPYTLLHNLSQWTRSSSGLSSLKNPPSPTLPALDPSDYSMISLLAGTKTSPNRRFPPQAPREDGPDAARKELNDRRAIVAVLNALLSVGGTGAAVWWAAGNIGWRDEWVRLISSLRSWKIVLIG